MARTNGELGGGNIKIAIAVEIPLEALQGVFRWLAPISLVLLQHYIF